mmetsp:Transcript_39751/g.105011  ORF Transcript_39751/g.105011 Transcript_39751/m.105011 type:complete len:363 (+) Transcript_39751:546-1634(+)
MLPMQPWPFARVVVGILSVALAAAYAWGCVSVYMAADEFNAYIATRKFDVKVTQVTGFDGPVNALIPHGQRCGGFSFAKCVEALPAPTDHQRWWGLVPAGEVGVVMEGVGSIRAARIGLFYLTLAFGSCAIIQPILSAFRNRPSMVGELSSAGVHAMAGMALMASLFGMFWDSEHSVVIINYVPGYGYFWFVVWMCAVMLLMLLAVVRRYWIYFILFLSTCVYWVVWLMLPLVGYMWFFSWKFVDVVAEQQQAVENGAHRSVPFSGKAASSLGPPFAVCAYLGFVCWVGAFLVSVASYARHLRLLNNDEDYRQAVFLEASRAQHLPPSHHLLTTIAIREVERRRLAQIDQRQRQVGAEQQMV